MCAQQADVLCMTQKPSKLSHMVSYGLFLLPSGLGSPVCHAEVWSHVSNNLVSTCSGWQENLGTLKGWYTDVLRNKIKWMSYFQTLQIERVQNPSLWKAYQIKKCQMDDKNGNNNNEKFLFHGTSAESLTFINNHGFNRSYAGMHGNVNFKTTCFPE